MDYQGLGRRVRRARKLAGMTQCELAERLSISTSFLGHIERGSRKASLETIIKIANELSISLDELLADGVGMLAALLAAGNLSFWLCDRALAALTRYYHVILKPKLKKKF